MTQSIEQTVHELLINVKGPADMRRACRVLEELGKTADGTNAINRAMLTTAAHFNNSYEEIRANLEQAQQIHDRLTAPPWNAAVYLRCLPDCRQVLVDTNGRQRVVRVVDELPLAELTAGDEVFLNGEMNLLVARAPWGRRAVGETAAFQRRTADGQLVLNWRDQDVIVEPIGTLCATDLNEGDLVTWDRSTFLAFERIRRKESGRQFLVEAPDASRENIGGYGKALNRLIDTLTTLFVDPDLARAYQVGGKNSILLVGAPGCGKSLMARIAAAEITRRSGHQCQFALVQPSAFADPFVGVTERNIRRFFAMVRRLAKQRGPVVVYMDELDGTGRVRGSFSGHHDDRHLTVLLAEMDGFVERGNVVFIGATNRKDLLDPALLERFSAVEIRVRRPDLRAAREIFAVHLGPTLPFSPNGDRAPQTRARLIDHAISKLYAPNADTELYTIRFQDGNTRAVAPRDLISGRVISQICADARCQAFLRAVAKRRAGICVEDIDEAVANALDRMATILTRDNARAYLDDLPHDVPIAGISRVRRPVRRPHRYLNLPPT